MKIYAIWSIGALSYGAIELLGRGYTHISMGIVGGICLLFISGLDEKCGLRLSLIMKMLISAVMITIIELISGLILNVWLDLGIWDYSKTPLNLFGQICVPFCGIWFLLSVVGIFLQNFVRWKLFCEEKQHYRIF